MNRISDEPEWEAESLPLDLSDRNMPTLVQRLKDEGLFITVEVNSEDSYTQIYDRIDAAVNVALAGAPGSSPGPPIVLPASPNPADQRRLWVVVRAENARSGTPFKYYKYCDHADHITWFTHATLMRESARGFTCHGYPCFMYLGEYSIII